MKLHLLLFLNLHAQSEDIGALLLVSSDYWILCDSISLVRFGVEALMRGDEPSKVVIIVNICLSLWSMTERFSKVSTLCLPVERVYSY
jgi:hypothetical protein